jgi:N-acetylmuramoyl-L-alanine amidase
MTKACLAFAFLCLLLGLPARAFSWETATSNGREYVTLRSFCTFYGFYYQAPAGNNRFVSRSTTHSIAFKLGSPDLYLDGVHYVMSFAVEGGDRDWLVSRMDVIKLFEPILRPTEIDGRHTIRGVVIDAGHGGSDNGATSRLGAEKDYTRDTAFRLEAILRAAGLKTVLTRRTDVFVDLYERAHIASLYSDYAFVSIHFNSATPEARGLETYCLSPRGAASTSSAYLTRSDIQKLPGNDYDALNILLASMVHSEIIRLNPGDGTADRGVKRARFVVIKQNVLPAILVEGGFVSNRMEAARINRPDYRQSLAQAIARGVIRFVNVMGDRHLALPGSTDDDISLAKPALPLTPPAPSGLAGDAPQKSQPAAATKTNAKKSGHTAATTPPVAKAGATPLVDAANPPVSIHKSKKHKTGKSAVTAATTNTPSASPPPIAVTTPTAPAADPAVAPVVPGDSGLTTQVVASPKAPETATAPLNLAEPKTPTPTAVAPATEKMAEPDEPPTVNIYPTVNPGVTGKSPDKPAALDPAPSAASPTAPDPAPSTSSPAATTTSGTVVPATLPPAVDPKPDAATTNATPAAKPPAQP